MTSDGWAAVDDFLFIPQSDSNGCQNQPPGSEPSPVSTTSTSPAQSCEDQGLLSCLKGGGCFSIKQKCDFYPDCQDESDELGCPLMFLFDDCLLETGSKNCGWLENPVDDLDWTVANDSETLSSAHPINRGNPFLWINKTGDDVHARAHVESPVYQNSRVDCYVMFYYIKTGTVGSHIQPGVHLVENDTLIVMDNLQHSSDWVLIEQQIGRRSGEMKLVFNRPSNNAYDAGVAVDDVSFVDCHMPRPTPGECKADKPYKCDNEVCLEYEKVCDLTDDCGDGSDENPDVCRDDGYIQNSFEDDNNPFGIFHEESSDEVLKWTRGSGMTPNPYTGPSVDHTTWTTEGHYLYIDSGHMENTEQRVLLVSEMFVKSSEDGPDCVMTLSYHMYGAGLGSLMVSQRSSSEEEEELWRMDGAGENVSKNKWVRQPIVAKKSKIYEQFIITISANVAIQGQGDIAIDDVVFSPECRLQGGQTTATTPATTSSQCDEGSQFQCGDGSCIPLDKVCNFHVDCPYPDTSDEAACPDLYDFENCEGTGDDGPDNCGWDNTALDTIDWQVRSLEELQSLEHSPQLDFQNKTSGHMLYVVTAPEGGVAGVDSPVYQYSATDCMFTFYVYLDDDDDIILYPKLTPQDLMEQIVIDQLDFKTLPKGQWSHVIIGIGRQRSKFSVGFNLVYPGTTTWNGGVAVDHVEFLGCGQPVPEENCLELQYHCAVTQACVDNWLLCDYADNCGDDSDEDPEIQNCHDYTRMNFEDELHPWGFFTETDTSQAVLSRLVKYDQILTDVISFVHQGLFSILKVEYFLTSLYLSQDFQWSRGNGSITASTGPPFDHTLFSPQGHYLYIAAERQEVGEVAWLVSPYLAPTTASDDCYTRWFYHMHGRGIGKLTVYIQ